MALKGKAIIQIFEGKKVIKEIREENMITNAITNILNPPDFVEMGIDAETDQSHNVLHIFKRNLVDTAFGGVLVFRDKIDENADNVMMPWKNEEIGHAGMTTTNANNKTGTYNANESGVIENGKGYRHVWDFGTDKANGNISCICLTTKDGGSNGYNGTYPEMAMGGTELNSSSTSSFSASAYNIIHRYINPSNIDLSAFKIFYVDRLENGNIRLLGKLATDCAIYELQIYDPNAISIRTDKPFCNIVSFKKVIELFPAPTAIPEANNTNNLYYHGSYFYTNASSQLSNVPADEQAKMKQNWEADPQWFEYFPYVVGDEIIIVAGIFKKIRHYTFSLADYKQKSLKTIDTTVDFCQSLTFNYERSSVGCKWFYGISTITGSLSAENAIRYLMMSGFIWDKTYFMLTKNPIINGERNTNITNYHQMEAFSEDGISTEKTLQYYDNSLLSQIRCTCEGFYVDEKSNTPLISYRTGTTSQNTTRTNSAVLRKLADGYGVYRIPLGKGGDTSQFNTYFQIIKVKGLSLPLYCMQGEPNNSAGNYRFNLSFAPIKLCLTTINNLSEPVRKLEGQTMKITYDIVEEDEV